MKIEKQDKKLYKNLYVEFERALLEQVFLKKMCMTKKDMQNLLKKDEWKQIIYSLADEEEINCKLALEKSLKTLNRLSETPECGWMEFTHEFVITEIYPERESFITAEERKVYERGAVFYLKVLRIFLKCEEILRPVDGRYDMKLLEKDEVKNCNNFNEYKNLIKKTEEYYVFEFLKLSRQIMPFDLFSHISGVHFIAMHISKQLKRYGVPIDISLVSGAAAMHDIGKYGCNEKEIKKIPYLHYYYTDVCLQSWGMPNTSHIASNHSTWDLEIENLPVEALVLIYSDFRVKSKRIDGKEISCFYSLEEAFGVILSKLDNLDDAKERRYRKVYAKLKDFEEYFVDLGGSTDIDRIENARGEKKDTVLMHGKSVVSKLKYISIDHNINVMHRFSDDEHFSLMIESARSERRWKNLRTYLNIFREYCNYMTKKQKQIVFKFMLELLSYREGDIRREAADMIALIISSFDEEYRKELPEGAVINNGETDSKTMWEKYLESVLLPDHKRTEQHNRWIGYTIKLTLERLAQESSRDEMKEYLGELLKYYSDRDYDEIERFIMLDIAAAIPFELCSAEDMLKLTKFVELSSHTDDLEVEVAALKAVYGFCQNFCFVPGPAMDYVSAVVDSTSVGDKFFAVGYLKNRTRSILENKECELLKIDDVSEVFRENLKLNTPWIIKSINIELLLDDRVEKVGGTALNIANHFSNLLKVCDRITVRHQAGEGLMTLIKTLSFYQRNEIVIELIKGLEIGEYEYSKYIPEYLGFLAVKLHPQDLDELIEQLKNLTESSNNRVASVALDTIGNILVNYPDYKNRVGEGEEEYKNRQKILLGILLKGMAGYDETIKREAVSVIGRGVFGNKRLDMYSKFEYFNRIYKKLACLIKSEEQKFLTFYTDAAALNHIYRFINSYMLEIGDMELRENVKMAFFPGSFDPFSSSHREIAVTIRDLGFEVFLAIDEFSWSKRTQPRDIRRKIAEISVAGEEDIYIFPEDIPINIANDEDISKLKRIWNEKEVYIVVGSDVVANASSYEKEGRDNSIHSLNHIVFRREGEDSAADKMKEIEKRFAAIKGNIIHLNLPPHLEDISSTRIRENIDDNREISNLIDTVAQNYIYDQGLYVREPIFKGLVDAEEMTIEFGFVESGKNSNNTFRAEAFTREMTVSELFNEICDLETVSRLRSKISGKILIIERVEYKGDEQNREKVLQILITETLAKALENHYSYCFYKPEFDYSQGIDGKNYNSLLTRVSDHSIQEVFKRCGFKYLENASEKQSLNMMMVDMRAPIVVFHNTEMMLKSPFNKKTKIIKEFKRAEHRFLDALSKLYPNELILSFDLSILHAKLIDLITEENGVERFQGKVRKLGKYMCVPFGDILKQSVVPNTVTKTLHNEKVFSADLSSFEIKKTPYYSDIANQVKTIKSFNRPVILLDDLLNKGYRVEDISKYFKREGIDIKSIIVGVLSANGRDLMRCENHRVLSAYFLPNIKNSFSEAANYPFIGGNTLESKEKTSFNEYGDINLILPYAFPKSLKDRKNKDIYNFSMTCLKNSYELLKCLEEVYEEEFEMRLTVGRLGEVFNRRSIPEYCVINEFAKETSASEYIIADIERLERMKGIAKED